MVCVCGGGGGHTHTHLSKGSLHKSRNLLKTLLLPGLVWHHEFKGEEEQHLKHCIFRAGGLIKQTPPRTERKIARKKMEWINNRDELLFQVAVNHKALRGTS